VQGRLASERGQVAVYAGLLFPVLMLTLAHVLAVGTIGGLRTRIRAQLDMAALTATQALDPAGLAAGLFCTPHSEVHEFYISANGGNKGCTYRARPTDDLRLFPKYLCVSSTFASQHYRQRVELQLMGKRTWLGFRITHFEPMAAP